MPRSLSKKKYLAKTQEAIDKMKASMEKDEDIFNIIKLVTLVIAAIMYILCGIYYILIGTRIGVTYFTVLSVIQILTVMRSMVLGLSGKEFSLDINDHKFRRLWLLFNVILDLVYYPLAIYLLLR
jgi:hypothetical protein